jgi:hypothetical protein
LRPRPKFSPLYTKMALPPGALFLQKPSRFSSLLTSLRQLQSPI